MPLCRFRQIAEAINTRVTRVQKVQAGIAEWQTKMICAFVGSTVSFDMNKTGGKNPLVDMANRLSMFRAPGSAQADAAEDDPRGEQTGWVSDEEGRKIMAGGGTSAPALDTLVVDEEQNVVGSALGAETTVDEQALGAAAEAGSFEGFMRMFGGGGIPVNTAPQPPSA